MASHHCAIAAGTLPQVGGHSRQAHAKLERVAAAGEDPLGGRAGVGRAPLRGIGRRARKLHPAGGVKAADPTTQQRTIIPLLIANGGSEVTGRGVEEGLAPGSGPT